MWLSVIEGLLNCSMQPTIAVYAADICVLQHSLPLLRLSRKSDTVAR
jgi:hypothetical protein